MEGLYTGLGHTGRSVAADTRGQRAGKMSGWPWQHGRARARVTSDPTSQTIIHSVDETNTRCAAAVATMNLVAAQAFNRGDQLVPGMVTSVRARPVTRPVGTSSLARGPRWPR